MSPGCRRDREVKGAAPDVEVCACLGLLSDGVSRAPAPGGHHAYNHNLNTAEAKLRDICTTHFVPGPGRHGTEGQTSWPVPVLGPDRRDGETDEELIDVVFALRELDPDSVPVNFLIPFEGHPLGGQWALTPQRCLRILAMVRSHCPDAEVRLAGGGKIHLRRPAPLACTSSTRSSSATS